ncbi:MAG: sugar phosphate nucleotidyltransferase [Candidatus Omnitrophica bacterium]|nr:sugar phosphate nucleotidyltransferase [Candidatus Omnitrophota bacterium]
MGKNKSKKTDITLVIMAGGKGNRMGPIIKDCPKPLIPLGGKSAVEKIIHRFKTNGIKKFYLILKYKSRLIESYFNNLEKDYDIEFIKEKRYLGTAGGLKLLEKKVNDVFAVSNCDTIIKINLANAISAHKKLNAWLTIISTNQNIEMQYGIIKLNKERVLNILEKPLYTFVINTGVYILNKKCLQFIPRDSKFSMTDLIASLIKNNRKVIAYPVSAKDYIDIGTWEKYKLAMNKLGCVGKNKK